MSDDQPVKAVNTVDRQSHASIHKTVSYHAKYTVSVTLNGTTKQNKTKTFIS